MSSQSDDTSVNVPALVERWRKGDHEAATELYNRYQTRLLKLVSRHINDKLRRRLDPEELVQSILKSAFRVTGEQDIGCHDETGFWKWLVTVALNKTFKRIDRETAAKRDPKREISADVVLGERILLEPTPADVAEVSELLDKILSNITDVQKQILLGKLDGQSHPEIAKQLGISTKTVQRNGQVIRDVAVAILGRNIPEWLIDEADPMSDQFAACLNSQAARWLPKEVAMEFPQVARLKLSEVFEQGQPNPRVLNGIRSVAKQRGMQNTDEVPQIICAAIYLMAIAVAWVKLGLRISSDEDSKLAHRGKSILNEPWIDERTAQLLGQFLDDMNG